jgi:hypothetical protein
MYNFDLSDEEVAVFERFMRAKTDYNKAEGVSLADKRAIKDIAAKSDRISNLIINVKNEHYTEAAKHMTKWKQHTLDGGENYREILFNMPNSTYSNQAMQGHWGEDAEGILAHARIQDFVVDGKKMLFVEEIQSDWHNEGHKIGYADKDAQKKVKELENAKDILTAERMSLYKTLLHDLTEFNRQYGMDTPEAAAEKHLELSLSSTTDAAIIKISNKTFKYPEDLRIRLDRYFELEQQENNLVRQMRNINKGVPDAPFKDTYHEYVMKRLIRMAAEEGYDSIGWTPAEIQVKRWSEEFAEGYRIEYDQDIPKFMNK